MLNRLTEHLLHKDLPESQCGFRLGRGTADMIFTTRQMLQKFWKQIIIVWKQNQDLYVVLVEFTKASESLSTGWVSLLNKCVG